MNLPTVPPERHETERETLAFAAATMERLGHLSRAATLYRLSVRPEPPEPVKDEDAALVADHVLRFWQPVPESYDVYQAAKRILVAAGQEIPDGPIMRYLREHHPELVDKATGHNPGGP